MNPSSVLSWQRQALIATRDLPPSIPATALVISQKALEGQPVHLRQLDISNELSIGLEATRRALRHLSRLGLLQIEPTRTGAWYRLEGGSR